MRYMLLIYSDERALNETERQECYQESAELAHQIEAAGQYLAAAPLQPTSEGVHVGVRRALAIGRFRRLAVWPAIPVHLGVEPVANVDERLGEDLE